MLAFVTVGSTCFDSLVQIVLSSPVLTSLHAKGYTCLTIQCGDSKIELPGSISDPRSWSFQRNGVTVELWKFKPSLQEEYERADLVISHAGSGTILDVLRLGKPMIVVPNPTLLNNHQEELASALTEFGHLHSSTVEDLPQAIQTLDPSVLVPFPAFDGSRFVSLLDEEMGFM